MDEELEQLAYESYCEDVPLELPLERQLAQLAEYLDGAREKDEMVSKKALPAKREHGHLRSLADRALIQLLRDTLQVLRHKAEHGDVSRAIANARMGSRGPEC